LKSASPRPFSKEPDLLTIVDDELRREADAFELRYTCGSCAHFDEDRRRCAEGFPIDPHVEDRARSAATLLFCKSFELA